ncbi:sensor histidine kinase [Rubricoccus marinus]|uniref:histidine kinase n=1 Tax=Rubricoccus marinus TaxID=716817 RepID=A0A259TWZ1_9BACT|nr:sensor histidine kinase [Rubricoccus marinus]OZC02068.1 hypothetical protein BSZ36_03155 [Rubricoccus marinus]
MPRRARLSLAFCGLALLLCAAGARAQAPEAEVRIDRLSVEDGLAQSIVTALVQDRHGFLWIGTEGGLDRYDGYTFTPYRNVPGELGSLSSSFVNALVETPDGAIWVGTHGAGLNRLDPASGVARRLRHVAEDPATISADRISALFADRDGRLWAGTERGLDLVDLTTARVRRVAEAQEVTDIAQDPASGDLWVATHEGLLRVSPASGRILRRYGAETLGGEQVAAVWTDADGTLWIGTDTSGLTRLDPRTGRTVRFADVGTGTPGVAVQDILRDARGALWVATMSGLVRMDVRPPQTERWTVFRPSETDPGSISAERVRTLAEDRTGLVWAGTWGAGLNKVRQTPFQRFAADPGRVGALSSNDVMGMAQDRDGTLWVGTYDRGLNRLDLATGAASQDPGWPVELRQNGVRAVAVDGLGAIWATGDARGLWRRDPGTERWARVPFEDGAGVESVTHVAAAPDGSIWAATYGGGPCHAEPLAQEVVCPARNWTGARALRSDLAYTVFAEADGRLWVSLWGSGADLVDPARGRVASFENRPEDPASLTDNNVTSFYRDARGELWLTTYGGGLNRLLSTAGGGRFAHITEADGLPNGTTYGILPDARGDFWVSTNRGLARMDPASGEMDTFGPDDGLPGEELNGYSFLKLRDGRMAFGGLSGLAVFNPDAITGDARPPQAVVTAVRVLGREIDVPATGAPAPIVLTHQQSAIAFDVAAMDFTAPDRNRYAFQLEGLESAWSPPSTRRTAAYTNLRPGRYTFRVRASGADGAWNPAALTIPVEVRPAWWQTWAFRLAAGAGLLALVVLGVREASQRRLRAEVQRLETEQRLQAERERISRDLHDHVGGQLSGLIASAELARLQRRRASRARGQDERAEVGASGERGRAGESAPFPPEADAIDRIEEDARETMRQLRETVWALHHESVTLADFRSRLDADLRQRLRGHERPVATVTLDGDATHVLSPLQALHLYRIAREAITNSLKHADAAHIAVTIRHSAGAVTVEIRDDGTFRAPGEEASGDGAAAEVSGFGMGSMRARTEAIGGRFDVETEAGTVVRVSVPV